jgi:perosamine synthetase
MGRIPVAGPWITQKEINYVTDAVTNGWYENATDYITRFENRFAEYSGVNFAISLPSCTSAIHLSLLACGVGPGDEVIVPDATWIATAAPVTYIGATPIFADIDRKTWCLSAESFEKCITPKTKAVILVDLYGNMPDMNVILEIANRYDINVIEDAAEAMGSEYKRRKAGSFGETGVFSFHGTKTLTTGEGGMLITDSEDIYQQVLFLRDHGRRPEDKMFYNREIAYKYKMSNLQAALGLAQLERIEELLSKKKKIFSWYQNRLGALNGVMLNDQQAHTKNTYWMVTVIIDKKYGLKKESVIKQLKEKNIDSRPFFYPLSSLPAYRDTIQARKAQNFNKISYEISPFGVNLPSALSLTKEKVDFVCEVLETNILKIK